MNIKKYWFIIIAPDYKQNKIQLDSKSFSSTIIALDSIEDACIAADELIKNGIEIIELCWWFEYTWYQKIRSHIKDKVPVGYVTFKDKND